MPAATAAFHSEGAATTAAAATAATLGPPSWRDGAGAGAGEADADAAAVAKLQLECVLAITLRIFHIAPAADAPPSAPAAAAVEEGAPEL